MRNLSHFLSGCVFGMLLTFMIYCTTTYFTNQDTQVSREPVKKSNSELDGYFIEVTTAGIASESIGESRSVDGNDTSSHTLPSLRDTDMPYLVSGTKQLLSLVISSIDQRNPTLKLVESTWGQSAEDHWWMVAMGTKGIDSPIRNKYHQFFLANDCYDFPLGAELSPGQLFCLLIAIHNSYVISQFKWFSISLNSTYIATDRLSQLLNRLDSSEVLYLGQPSSFSATEMAALNLKSGENICIASSGIVISRKAVEDITPHLGHCLRLGGGVKAMGDVELGRCFNRMLKVTCSKLLSLEVNDPSSLFVSEPNSIRLLENFVTYYPIRDEYEMLTIRLYDIYRKIRIVQDEANKVMHSANQLCTRLPHPEAVLGKSSNLCNLTIMHSSIAAPRLYLPQTQPSKLDEIVRWELITDNRVYNSEKLNPVLNPTPSRRQEIKSIFDKTVAYLGGGGEPINVQNMFVRHMGSLGREYILDVEFKEGIVSRERRLSLLLPNIGDLVFVDANEPQFFSKIIEFIVPLSNVNKRLTEFLKMYANLCLETDERCSLNLVVYGDKDIETIREELRKLREKYRHAKLNLIKGTGRFSRGRALESGLAHLPNTSLAFICDVDMIIERNFLRRCQRNTIPGRRVYYPEFFKYYNMDYVYRFSKKPQWISIGRQHGHWATYSYGMLCIYKSDYLSIGGFDDVEGWGGEDVLLAENVLKHRLDMFRVPDPALSHRYHDKMCSAKLNPRQFANCISSRNENLADRTRLAEYVFYLEDHCNVKHWKLWSWR